MDKSRNSFTETGSNQNQCHHKLPPLQISKSFQTPFCYHSDSTRDISTFLKIIKKNKKTPPLSSLQQSFDAKQVDGKSLRILVGNACCTTTPTNHLSLSLSLRLHAITKKAKQNGQRNQIERRCMVRECRLYGLTDTVEFSRIHTRCNNMRCTTREAPCVLGSALLRVN